QILAIDGQPFSSDISHEEAINILQRAHGIVELVIARGQTSKQCDSLDLNANPSDVLIERSPSGVSDSSKDSNDMVLNTEWAQIEAIELDNDGSGLGFGIIGGRSTGVIIKTLVPGGVADRDNRLQSGDHILQINDINMRGMGSDQVAQVLRQTGAHVRLIVARPVDPTSDLQVIQSSAPIVPTRSLADPEDVEKHLALFQQQQLQELPKDIPLTTTTTTTTPFTNGHESNLPVASIGSITSIPIETQQIARIDLHSPPLELQTSEVTVSAGNTSVVSNVNRKVEVEINSENPIVANTVVEELPEMETFEVELIKDQQGLGITIAGYVCEKEEISGIFIKSIAPGSVADLSNQICINDQIIEVDGRSLYGYTNHQAVEVLRNTGKIVKLRLARYLRGSKYEQLQQAIASPDLPAPYYTPPGATVIQIYDQSTDVSQNSQTLSASSNNSDSRSGSKYNAELIEKWQNIIGSSFEIVIANIVREGPGLGISLEGTVDVENGNEVRPHHYIRSILPDGPVGVNGILRSGDELLEVNGTTLHGMSHSDVVPLLKDLSMEVQMIANIVREGPGLGISLEGTVDVENGNEVRPHHYIRSILPDGPVGVNGILRSGDELLEVNGTTLHGMSHSDVVPLLKDLSMEVQMVCARPLNRDILVNFDAITDDNQSSTSRTDLDFHSVNNSLISIVPSIERLVKAKSDGSLAMTAPTVSIASDLTKMKSRSLEPLTGLAMWSSEVELIELIKGDKGLGFSILDYQDPMNPTETVIVIRSLVPGGIAQQDGRLIPGDRLLFVNDTVTNDLDVAVRTLKTASKGKVVIGVAKPLPLPESTGAIHCIQSPTNSQVSDFSHSAQASALYRDRGLTSVEVTDQAIQEQTIDILDNKSFELSEQSLPSLPSLPPLVSQPLRPEDEAQFSKNQVSRQESINSVNSVDSQISSSAVSLAEHLMFNVAIERNNNVVISSSPTSSASNLVFSESRSSTPLDYSSSRSPSPSYHNLMAIPLPVALERTIKIRKGTEPLGLTLELADRGINGMIVKNTSKTGAIFRDGRISRGDHLLSINNESLRNITNSKARAILRRAQLIGNEIIFKYIPASDAEVHKQSSLLSMQHNTPNTPTPPLDRTSPSVGPLLRRSPSPRSPYFGPKLTLSDSDSDIEITSFGDRSAVSSVASTPPQTQPTPDFLDNLYTRPPIASITTFKPLIKSSNSILDAQEIASNSTSSEFAVKTQELGSTHSQSQQSSQELIRIESLSQSSHKESPKVSPRKSKVPENSPKHPMDQICSESDKQSVSPETGSTSSDTTNNASITSTVTRQWGEERVVQLIREHNKGLGISIVGGKVELFNTSLGNAISGIFIKNILADSPAGREGTLKSGDRVLSVDGVDLQEATHDRAVEAIKNAKNPVIFMVQSLLPFSKDSASTSNLMNKTETSMASSATLAAVESVAEEIGSIASDECCSSPQLSAPLESHTADDDKDSNILVDLNDVTEEDKEVTESEFDINGRDLTGKIRTSKGVQIDRSSAGNIRLSSTETQESNEDDLKEDEFGYSSKKVQKKYGDLNGYAFLVDLCKGLSGLGISLAGNRDRTKMSVFVCGLHPKGSAYKDGRIQIGDEILEVNGIVVQGRCHLNASAIIKSLIGPLYRIIVLRRDGALNEMAVKPLTQFPVHLEDDIIEEKYSKYKGVRTITVRKGTQGLGIMIIEGKHTELGRGVFVSDIQDGSPAEFAGLLVGDMILCVNLVDLIGADYEMAASALKSELKIAASALKSAEGLLTLVVAKPTKISGQDMFVETDSTENLCSDETKKELINPQHSDLKTCQVRGGKETTIEIVKEKLGLGLSIVGGSDTPLTTIEIVKEKLGLGLSIVGGSDTPLNAVIIHEVYPDGAAALDGRLKPGDQILAVNNEDLRDALHERAIAALRQTPPVIKLTVFRDNAETQEEDASDMIDIELHKKSGKGLGLSIVGKKSGSGVFISEVVKGGIAESDARPHLMVGDQILE
ncbi:unnamed protein product, partial [Medioppia subpectinata]